MNSFHDERRKHPRIEIELDIDYISFDEDSAHEESFQSSTTKNISEGGFCYYSKQEVNVGKKIRFFLELPSGPIYGIGLIVYSIREKDELDWMTGVAIEYVNTEDKQQLTQYIQDWIQSQNGI